MKFIIGQPGGPSGPFYSVVAQNGELVAMQIVSKYWAEVIRRSGEAISGDAKFQEQARRRLYAIIERDYPNEYKPIDTGAYDYVIRAVIEAILHE